jgi:hypothetical protein
LAVAVGGGAGNEAKSIAIKAAAIVVQHVKVADAAARTGASGTAARIIYPRFVHGAERLLAVVRRATGAPVLYLA